jgi:predicted lipoprotein with Yx(FWY)xxD motif
MWAYDGMPLYLFADDKKAGDITGDGEDGFHVAKAE